MSFTSNGGGGSYVVLAMSVSFSHGHEPLARPRVIIMVLGPLYNIRNRHTYRTLAILHGLEPFAWA